MVSEVQIARSTKTPRGIIAGIIVGGVLTLAPFYGMALTALSMFSAFRRLDHSGLDDRGALASDIHGVLMSTAIGLVLCPIGLVILTASLFLLYLRRSRSPGGG